MQPEDCSILGQTGRCPRDEQARVVDANQLIFYFAETVWPHGFGKTYGS